MAMQLIARIPRWLLISMSLCVLWCLILALDLIPQLRGDFGWRWGYELPNWLRLIPAVVAIIIYVVVAARLTNPRAVQGWSFIGAIVIPLACLFVLGDPIYILVTRTLSGLATGAHAAGADIVDLGAALRNWPAIMPTYLEPSRAGMISIHNALSPPGLPAFYHTLNQLLATMPSLSESLSSTLRPYQCQNISIMSYSNAQLASAWFGVLVPVWSALTVLPLYRAGGRLAALWWPLIPSVVMFTPVWNTLYPLLSITAYLLLNKGSQDWRNPQSNRIRAGLLIVVAGFLVSLLTFANFSTVPLLGFLGLYVVFALIQQRQSIRQALLDSIAIGVLFTVGAISIWAAYYLTTGITPMTLLNSAMNLHLDLERPYLPWIYLHLYDLAIFTGFPLVAVALSRIVASVPRSWQIDLSRLDPLSLSLGISLIALALSGTARGETGRVWLFFVPFILVLAARQLAQFSPSSISLVTITQAVMLLTLVAFLRTIGTEPYFQPSPAAPPTAEIAADILPAPIQFEGGFSLIGRRGVVTEQGIDLTLSWRAERQASYPYYLSALPVGPDSKAIPPSVDWQPFDNKYPITCWRPGEIVTETRHLPLGDNMMPGDYWISLSAFALQDGKPIPVAVMQSGSSPDSQVGLGPISFSR